MGAENRLKELGITLPAPGRPAGMYVPAVESGRLLFVSGQLPLFAGKLTTRGKLGDGLSADQGAQLARRCAVNALGVARDYLGSLDRVARVVKVTGFVASAPGFVSQPQVINGASEVLVEVFGEQGRHARSAIGLAELPLGAPVEVEFIFEIAPSGATKAKSASASKDVEAKDAKRKKAKDGKKKSGKKDKKKR